MRGDVHGGVVRMSETWELFTDDCQAELPAASVVDVQDFVVVRRLRFEPQAGGGTTDYVLANDYVSPHVVGYELDRRLHELLTKGARPEDGLVVEEVRGGCPLDVEQTELNSQVRPREVVELAVGDVGAFLAGGEFEGTRLTLTLENTADLAAGRPTVVDLDDKVLLVSPEAGLDPGDAQPLVLTGNLVGLVADPFVSLGGRRERLALDGRAIADLASTGNTVVGLSRDTGRRVTVQVVAGDQAGVASMDGSVGVQRSAITADGTYAATGHEGPSRMGATRAGEKLRASGLHEVTPLPEYPIMLCATYRQGWALRGYARGRMVSSLSVAPQEEVTVEVTTVDKRATTYEKATTDERTTTYESSVAAKTSRDVVGELTRNKNWKFTAGGNVSVPIKAVTLGGSVGSELTKQTQTVDKNNVQTIDEETFKASQTLRSRIDTKITEIHEWSTETRSTRKLRNPNLSRVATYDFFEVLAGYEVATEVLPDSVQLGVAVDLPFSVNLDRSFLLRHEGVLVDTLLDTRQEDGFAAARWLTAHELWCAESCRCARRAVPPPTNAALAAEGTQAPAQPAATAVEHTPEMDAACTAIRDAVVALRDASYTTLADLVGTWGKPDSEWRAAELVWHRYLYRRYGLEAFNSLFWAACLSFADVQNPTRWDLEKLLRSADTGFIETVIRGLAIQLQAIDLAARLAVDLVQVTWKLPIMLGKANFDDALLGVAIGRGRRALEAVEDADETSPGTAAESTSPTGPTSHDGAGGSPTTTGPKPVPQVTAAADPYPESECAAQMVAEQALIEHLRFNQDHYLGALWDSLSHLDQQRMLQARYETLVDWTDPTPLAVLDGKLVLPLRPGLVADADNALTRARADLAAGHDRRTRSVVIPTGATHVEGRLGRCDVLEPALVSEREQDLAERTARALLAHHAAAQEEAEADRFRARLDQSPPLLGNPKTATDPDKT
jgi:hypothetical protein